MSHLSAQPDESKAAVVQRYEEGTMVASRMESGFFFERQAACQHDRCV